MAKPRYNAFDNGVNYLLNYDTIRSNPYGIGNPYDVINNNMSNTMHFDVNGNLGMLNNNGTYSYQTYGAGHTPTGSVDTVTSTGASNFNPYGIASSLAGMVGNTVSSLAEDSIRQNNPDNPYYQNVFGNNTWGNVFNGDEELDTALRNISSGVVDYSGIKNNNNLLNTWDENAFQKEAVGTSTGQKLASSYGETLSDAATGAGLGTMIMPGLGTAIGAGLGALAGGIKSWLNFKDEDEELEKINRAVRRANKITTDNFYNTAQNNIARMNRETFMHTPYAEGGSLDELNGVTKFNVGGTHQQNPYEGIQQGIASDGNSNLVEEGEIKWNDYIFSARNIPSESLLKKYKLI